MNGLTRIALLLMTTVSFTIFTDGWPYGEEIGANTFSKRNERRLANILPGLFKSNNDKRAETENSDARSLLKESLRFTKRFLAGGAFAGNLFDNDDDNPWGQDSTIAIAMNGRMTTLATTMMTIMMTMMTMMVTLITKVTMTLK